MRALTGSLSQFDLGLDRTACTLRRGRSVGDVPARIDETTFLPGTQQIRVRSRRLNRLHTVVHILP